MYALYFQKTWILALRPTSGHPVKSLRLTDDGEIFLVLFFVEAWTLYPTILSFNYFEEETLKEKD